MIRIKPIRVVTLLYKSANDDRGNVHHLNARVVYKMKRRTKARLWSDIS